MKWLNAIVALALLSAVVVRGEPARDGSASSSWEYGYITRGAGPVTWVTGSGMVKGADSYELYVALGGKLPKEKCNTLSLFDLLGSQGWEMSAVGEYSTYFKRRVR